MERGEKLEVSFDGPAYERHEISAASLAQSLLAFDGLSKSCAHAVYGKECEIEVKVQGAPRQGSFIIDLIITHPIDLIITHPVEAMAFAGSAVTVLAGVIKLAKWAYGKGVRIISESDDKVVLENESSNVGEFEKTALQIYRMSKTRIDLSRLTQTLDTEGADSIRISGKDGISETITRDDRRFFRQRWPGINRQ